MDRSTFVKEWISDLRSGKFSQCQGSLKVDNFDGTVGYCCLGVACETAIRLGIINTFDDGRNVWGDDFPGGWFQNFFSGNESDSFDPAITINNQTCSCSEANDDIGASFAEIAQALENKYL